MTNKLQVLLVDNSPIQSRGIFTLLNHYNDYISIEQVKGDPDMIIKKNISPDLIVIDNNIPFEDGAELLITIRMKHPETKVIMLTQDSEPYYKNMCELLGAYYHYDSTAELCSLPESLKLMILGYQIAA